MKNILFASTALVALGGAAAADVAISGSAEIGIFGGKTAAGATTEMQFHTDIDVNFSMSGETDNGLSFGASIDLDETDGAAAVGSSNAFDADNQGGETYFVAFGNARLDMGDTDGAFDAAMIEVNLVGGSINDAETAHAGFNGNAGLDGTFDGQIARFSYTTAGFTGHASVELDDSGAGDAVFGLGVRYGTDLGGATVNVGAGYQSTNSATGAANTGRTIWGVSASAAMTNGLQAGVNYSVQSRDAWAADAKHTAIGVGYTMNNIGLGLNWGQTDGAGGVAGAKESGWGLAATYDLGGGMVAQFGYGDNTTSGDQGNSYSLGLAMSF
ncbi:MAG: porin [Pelagimonas sp.]